MINTNDVNGSLEKFREMRKDMTQLQKTMVDSFEYSKGIMVINRGV